MVKVTTTYSFCITGRPDSKLEDILPIRILLSNPEDKSVAKDVARKFQKFYFRDKSNSSAVFSHVADVRNSFLFCSHSTKFSMSVQLGSVMVREKLRSTVLDSRIVSGISKLQEA
jgi:hypothetical protein